MNLIMNNANTITTALLILIIIIQVFEIIRLKSKKNHYESEMVTYAGGVQRMMDFISHKKLIKQYQDYSLEKYGEKKDSLPDMNPVPPPPPKKEY